MFPMQVFAIANPDSIAILDTYVFEDCLETGDVLVYVRYSVEYGSEPEEPAEDTFLLALYGTDGTTLLGGCVRPLNYYQENIISVYKDAASNPLVSGSAYYVKVMGSPALFALEENVNVDTYVLDGGDYLSAEFLAAKMVEQATILQTDWATTLLTANDKLNTTGSYYFQKAIPGLASMDSTIFAVSSSFFTYARNESIGTPGLNTVRENMPVSLNSAMHGMNQIFGVTNENWGQFGWGLFAGMVVGGVMYAATRRPDVALFGGVLGTMGLEAYLGMSEGNMLLFLMAVGTVIIVLFIVGYVIPRWG